MTPSREPGSTCGGVGGPQGRLKHVVVGVHAEHLAPEAHGGRAHRRVCAEALRGQGGRGGLARAHARAHRRQQRRLAHHVRALALRARLCSG